MMDKLVSLFRMHILVFIQSPSDISEFLTRLANSTLVKKVNGKWLFIDFTDHNKVCPKGYYLLPRIDQMIDITMEVFNPLLP